VVRESDGARTESQPAIMVDHGFLSGGEHEFEALLRRWCVWANERGLDTLSIFSSDASPGYGLLRSLASTVEPFFVWTPGIEEPAGSAGARHLRRSDLFLSDRLLDTAPESRERSQPICKLKHQAANCFVFRKRIAT
jgi:hypothetical protein